MQNSSISIGASMSLDSSQGAVISSSVELSPTSPNAPLLGYNDPTPAGALFSASSSEMTAFTLSSSPVTEGSSLPSIPFSLVRSGPLNLSSIWVSKFLLFSSFTEVPCGSVALSKGTEKLSIPSMEDNKSSSSGTNSVVRECIILDDSNEFILCSDDRGQNHQMVTQDQDVHNMEQMLQMLKHDHQMAHIQKQLREEGTVHFPNGSHSPQKVSQELHQDLHHWVKAYGPEDYSHHEHQVLQKYFANLLS
nr:hypothetical protein Iba_chr01eCG1220 [Ipomoea batatas]